MPFLALGHFFAVLFSVAFNKVKIKGIAKKMLSNYTFVTSKYNRGAAARRGEAHGASGAFSCGFNKVKIKGIAKIISLIKLLTARHNHGWSATRSFPRLTRLFCGAFEREYKAVRRAAAG